jgi:hypothetical protein
MAKKAHYSVSEAKKTVTYTVGTLTEKERAEVAEYKEGGYEIVIKQKEKKKGLTFDDMKKKAKGKAFEKELLEKIENKENYMQIRKWFLEQTK